MSKASMADIRAGLAARIAAKNSAVNWTDDEHSFAAGIRVQLKADNPDMPADEMNNLIIAKTLDYRARMMSTLLPPGDEQLTSRDLISKGLEQRGYTTKRYSAADRQGRDDGQEGKKQGATIPGEDL
jgi:hypothetical protein